jgi:hypothetical protein
MRFGGFRHLEDVGIPTMNHGDRHPVLVIFNDSDGNMDQKENVKIPFKCHSNAIKIPFKVCSSGIQWDFNGILMRF